MSGAAALQVGNLLWQIFYFLFMFGLVVLLSVLVTRLWVKKGNPLASSRGRNLRLLEFLPLGTGKGLYLVRVPDAVWLVGVTDQTVSLLREYPPTVELEEVVGGAGGLTLPAWLPLRKPPAATSPIDDQVKPDSFTRQLLERIQQLKEPRQ